MDVITIKSKAFKEIVSKVEVNHVTTKITIYLSSEEGAY